MEGFLEDAFGVDSCCCFGGVGFGEEFERGGKFFLRHRSIGVEVVGGLLWYDEDRGRRDVVVTVMGF